MNNIKDVLLSSTLHDPRGVFLDTIRNASKVVLGSYGGWVINVTPETDQRVKNEILKLAGAGVYMTEAEQTEPLVANIIENHHLHLLQTTVAVARDLDIRKVQYTDGDRVITAATHYPQDLQKMAGRASELVGDTGSYVNFRRSVEDYFAHHPPLVQTELEFNRLYSEVFGMPIDIGSTAHGMSLDVVQEVLHRSPQMEAVSFPHPKWLLIAKEMGVPIKSEETHHVLTFETPDQFKKEVKERIDEAAIRYDLPVTPTDSPYEKMQQDYMATIGFDSTISQGEWNLRFKTEREYLTVLKNHVSIFGFSQEREGQVHNEINRSLVSMEGRNKAITEALRKPPQEVHRMIQERAEHVLSQKTSNFEGK